MLIGLFLIVCGCILYVLIKPSSAMNKVEGITASKEQIGEILYYTDFKRSRHLVLPKGFPNANTGLSQSNLDREAKQNA
jgi:hypothetical protein